MKRNVTQEQLERVLFDAGLVFLNYGETDEREAGVTKGGANFSVDAEYFELERDLAMGKEKGAKRLINLAATITVNMSTASLENLKDALGGVAKKDGDKLTSKIVVEDSDYLENVTIVGEDMGGKYKACTIFNALSDETLEIPFEPREDNTVAVTFSAHFDPENSDYGEGDLFEIEELSALPE